MGTDDPDRRAAWARVVARAWTDEGFKGRLISDPAAVLAEGGIDVSEGVSVRVVEDSDTQRTLVIPPAPGDEELSDETLQRVAGGFIVLPGDYCD